MLRKQNLASAVGIQKENWGNHAFSEIIKLLFRTYIHTFHYFLQLFRIIVA